MKARTLLLAMLGLSVCAVASIQAQPVIPGAPLTLTPRRTPTPGQGIYNAPVVPSPEWLAEREARTGPPVRPEVEPHDPAIDLSQIQPEAPPSGQDGDAALAPGDFEQFRNSNILPGATNVSTINEPSIGMNGRVVFASGNWWAGFSGDYGTTWQFVNPADNFPADGVTDNPANAGTFCCDQIVYYERTRGLMVWLLQYNANGNTNIQRIAIARSQADVLNNNWFWYDFTPGDIGYAATGFWLDFPDLAVSNNFLYLTTNVFAIGATTTTNSVIVRLPLDDLKAGGGLGGWRWNLNRPTPRPTHGATTRMFFGTHNTTSQLRIFHVAENSTTLQSNDVSHTAYATGNMTSSCPDGTNWLGRADTRILGAWRSGNEIGFMWTSNEHGGFAFPYVRVVRVNFTTWANVQNFAVWNSEFAFAYPAVHPNDRGHLGGVINYGCGTFHPIAAAWMLDDFNGFPTFGPLELQNFASSADGPNRNAWGDYNTARRMVQYSNTWAGAGFRMAAGGNNGNTVPEFVWFGRERDMPPSIHTIFVNLANTSGYETGTSLRPYNTVTEGNVALTPGDNMIIVNGTYIESVLLQTQSFINSQGGSAVVGGN